MEKKFNKKNGDFLSVMELANILGISRVAVFRRIKKGEIRAEKAGRNYIIYKKDIADLLGSELTDKLRGEISQAVEKVIHDYGDVLKRLGND